MSGKLKEVRERIKSVKSTQQITKAMKMVSASKLRRAQQDIEKMRPYANRLNHMLVNIISNLEGDVDTPYGDIRDINAIAMVVITSSKGLCGAFNSNVIKSAKAKLDGPYKALYEQGRVTLLPIGKKGFEFFSRHYPKLEIIADHVDLVSDLTFENVEAAASIVMDGFAEKLYDRVDVSYGRFKNAAVQYPETVRFLPVGKMDADKEEDKLELTRADYIFEPDKQELLDILIPSILKTTFHKFVLDNHASEHGARMTAMDSATENAQELLGELRINYNKARQEAITKELSEIVGGAAALSG